MVACCPRVEGNYKMADISYANYRYFLHEGPPVESALIGLINLLFPLVHYKSIN